MLMVEAIHLLPESVFDHFNVTGFVPRILMISIRQFKCVLITRCINRIALTIDFL